MIKSLPNYTVICNGVFNCYYDVKKVPQGDETVSVWEYAWGSLQMGITPGHIRAAWIWDRIE